MTLFTRHYKNQELIEIPMSQMERLIKDEANKEEIAEYVYQRLYNRFLKVFDFISDKTLTYEKNGIKTDLNMFNEEYKNGFLIMTSCSLLIETFASFLNGHNETPSGKSKEMFNNVFEYAESNDNELKIFKNGNFYSKVRCGILHQGETYGKFKITRKGENLFNEAENKIDASIFLIHLKNLLNTYKTELKHSRWDSKLWDTCRMKIRHIVNNAN